MSCLYIFSISTLAKKENLLKDSYKQSSAACGQDGVLSDGVLSGLGFDLDSS